jgi:hypothetical protein
MNFRRGISVRKGMRLYCHLGRFRALSHGGGGVIQGSLTVIGQINPRRWLLSGGRSCVSSVRKIPIRRANLEQELAFDVLEEAGTNDRGKPGGALMVPK